MNEPIISVSGLRGIVGETLTPQIAIRYVAAFSASLPDGPVVVTRDGRHTGPMVLAAVQSALLASGRTCLDAGVAATPTTGVLVRHLGAVGGIQISASHNPREYNGLKLFDQTGRVIPAGPGQAVLDRYREDATSWNAADQLGIGHTIDDTVTAHLAMVAAVCDVDRIRARRFKVLLDSNNGSGSVLGVPLLRELGCDITLLGGEVDGNFGHTPEPTAENLKGVLALVKETGADVGFCQDPDADRLAVIDERGNYIGEEHTVSLCMDHVLRSTPGPVVTNCSTSRMTQDLAAKYDVPFFRSKVGEANVVDLMLKHDAVLGGEGNGGIIDPRVGFVRDSFVSMALILDAMVAREKTVSELAAEMPSYSIHKTKVQLPTDAVPQTLDQLERHFSDAAADRLDGLRLDWADRWLLVRASNTEPIVRIVAEAPSIAEAESLCESCASAIA